MSYPKPPTVNRHGLANTSQGFQQPYIAIVLHIAGGSLAGADSWFDNEISDTRVNYMVGWSGEIHEYYDPASNVRGFQHGIIQGPVSHRFLALHRAANLRNPNTWAVGIEHEDFQQGDVSRQFREHPAMFEASTSLSAWLCDRFDIPVSNTSFLCHAEIDAINRVNCPMPSAGREDMITRYVQRVREKLGQGDDDMATPESLLQAARAMNRAQLGELNGILSQGVVNIVGAPSPEEAPGLYEPGKSQYHNTGDLTRNTLDHWLKDHAAADEEGGDADRDHTHPVPDHTHGGVEE